MQNQVLTSVVLYVGLGQVEYHCPLCLMWGFAESDRVPSPHFMWSLVRPSAIISLQLHKAQLGWVLPSVLPRFGTSQEPLSASPHFVQSLARLGTSAHLYLLPCLTSRGRNKLGTCSLDKLCEVHNLVEQLAGMLETTNT